MSKIKLNLIAAACENMGIGINGTLPWRLKKEMAYFTKMTKDVSDPEKMNAVIMGRLSWESIPLKSRPLPDRVNIVLTKHVEKIKNNVPEGVIVVSNLDDAIKYIDSRSDIESSWVIGGAAIYKLAMEHQNCDKIYLTEIHRTFECDTFFPTIDKSLFQLAEENGVSNEIQTDGDITYNYRVYKKIVNGI